MAFTMEALNLPVTRPQLSQDLQNEDIKPGGPHSPV